MANFSFIDIVNQFITSDKVSLPVFNPSAMRVQRELALKEPDIKKIERIITADQSLSSQVLKHANSAFYSGLSEVSSIKVAIMRLGMHEIGNVVLLAATEKTFKVRDKHIAIIIKKLWQHSAGCAFGAVWLAKRHDFGVPQSQAFFAGLFHDVGKLFLLMVIEQVKRYKKDVKITDDLLMETMGKMHSLQGYKLLQQWNVPDNFCQIAKEHHNPNVDKADPLMLLVRMSNMMCHKLGIGLLEDKSLILPATREFHLLNLTEIDVAELEIILEDTSALTH